MLPAVRSSRSCFFLVTAGLLAACAGPPRWVPPAHAGESGSCSPARSCRVGDTECDDAWANDMMTCEVDHARQVAEHDGGAAAFDELATFVLTKGGHCHLPYEARRAAGANLRELYPSVRRLIDATFEAGRVDLATRRAQLVQAAFAVNDDDLGPDPDLQSVLLRGRAFHDAEAKRLAEVLPAAALFHQCAGPFATSCPSDTSEARSKMRTLAGSAAWHVDLQVSDDCKGVVQREWFPSHDGLPGAWRTLRVVVEVDHCIEQAPAIDTMSLSCLEADATKRAPGDQGRAVRVERRIEHAEAHATVVIDGHTSRLDAPVTAERIQVPQGCLPIHPPTSTSPAMYTAVATIANRAGELVRSAAVASPDDFTALARELAQESELDRADHFYELALLASEHAEQPSAAREEATAWFSRRYGTAVIGPSLAETKYVLGRPYLNTEIGLVLASPNAPDEPCD